jgi:hypothetical protein
MRPAVRTVALAAIILFPCGSGAAQTPRPADAQPSNRILTPQDDSARNARSVAESPLSDLNLVRQRIPPILLSAIKDPYARPVRPGCRALTAEIGRLYDALGRDFDDPTPPHDKSMTRSGGSGLRLMHSAAEWLIPYDGFVRTLSGAQRRDQHILDAINAGDARRAYLKGLGEARNCPPPASPAGHGLGGGARPRFQ